jgi:hypothetical protein
MLETGLVEMFWIRKQDHTFHLDFFAETLEIVSEEGGIGKEFRVLSFLYTLR